MNIKRIALFSVVTGIGLLNLYMLFGKSTSESYSITRKWKTYYSLENWNIPNNAHVDLDHDGKTDSVTYEGCAVINSISAQMIPADKQCNKPDGTPRAYAGEGNELTIGTQLSQSHRFNPFVLPQSFLVQTDDNRWRYYEFYGLQVKAFELGDDLAFKSIPPSILDYIDALYFQTSHTLITLLLIPFTVLPALFQNID